MARVSPSDISLAQALFLSHTYSQAPKKKEKNYVVACPPPRPLTQRSLYTYKHMLGLEDQSARHSSPHRGRGRSPVSRHSVAITDFHYLSYAEDGTPEAFIPFSHSTHRSHCEACKLRAERIAEAKARVENLKSAEERRRRQSSLPPWRPVGGWTESPSRSDSPAPLLRRSSSISRHTTLSSPQPRVNLAAITPRIDTGLRSQDSRRRSWMPKSDSTTVVTRTRGNSVTQRPPWNASFGVVDRSVPRAEKLDSRPPTTRRLPGRSRPPSVIAVHRPATPAAQEGERTLRGKAPAKESRPSEDPDAFKVYPIKKTQPANTVDLPTTEGTLSDFQAPVEQSVICEPCSGEAPLKTDVIYPVEQASLVTMEFESEEEVVQEELDAVEVALQEWLPQPEEEDYVVVDAPVNIAHEGEENVADASHIEEGHYVPDDEHSEIESETTLVDAATDIPQEVAAGTSKTPSRVVVQSTLKPPVVIRRRPRIDISDLTGLATHVSAAFTSLQTHHSTLVKTPVSSASYTDIKAAYISSARTITTVATSICKSYRPPAETCLDRTLREQLLKRLEKVEVLSGQMKAVTRSKEREDGDRDLGGQVVACAENLVKEVVGAVNGLEAVGIRL